jgi:hypothetical protein
MAASKLPKEDTPKPTLADEVSLPGHARWSIIRTPFFSIERIGYPQVAVMIFSRIGTRKRLQMDQNSCHYHLHHLLFDLRLKRVLSYVIHVCSFTCSIFLRTAYTLIMMSTLASFRDEWTGIHRDSEDELVQWYPAWMIELDRRRCWESCSVGGMERSVVVEGFVPTSGCIVSH